MIIIPLEVRAGAGKNPQIVCRIGENNTRELHINLIQDEEHIYQFANPVEGYFRVVKPDNTFVLTSLEMVTESSGFNYFKCTIPAEACQIVGTGYYDIRIAHVATPDDLLFSAQGDFIIDDNILHDDMIASVAAVDGLIFPDDFLTTESGAAMINDNATNLTDTWSSTKISNEIAAVSSSEIDDNVTDTDSTWSSTKISNEIAGATPEISHDYSTTKKKVGRWIDNKDIYEIVLEKTSGYWTLPGMGNGELSLYDNTLTETARLPYGCKIFSAMAVCAATGHGNGGGWQTIPLCVKQDNTASPTIYYSTWTWQVSVKYIIVQYIEP